ncbi:glycerate kinase [Sunxiuqinia elliptica]|uniref:Glycerate kinase n=1 Tax=Sunxiuqinia elliptica TaxID=655355 RepID=A0A1I2HL40_9BACT|nr:glycerate kinase [Sunxiuqinia elliptica]SFF29111.1 glycerate kinase [Sunxiuqinia elliptica]
MTTQQTMNILLCPDSFKDCLSAQEVIEALATGVQHVFPEAIITKIPLADGGEGFVQTLLTALGGQLISIQVKNPLGRLTDASYGILGDKQTAVIEMAAASGIELLKPEERNPMLTSTFGTGQLLLDAMQRGCRNLIIGIGGSATNDGGTGMAKALGYRFLNIHGDEIAEGGGELAQLHHIDTSKVTALLKQTQITVACDVTNPLTGTHGASSVYGPQKGATAEMVEKLDENLQHLANCIEKDLDKTILDLAGGGAAGGLGAGLVAFAHAELSLGFDIVKEQTQLEKAIQQADFIITGEGKMDVQTKQGKTPWGVAQLAKKHHKPCLGIAGFLGEGYQELYQEGFTSLLALPNGPISLQESIQLASELLADKAEQAMRLISFYRH